MFALVLLTNALSRTRQAPALAPRAQALNWKLNSSAIWKATKRMQRRYKISKAKGLCTPRLASIARKPHDSTLSNDRMQHFVKGFGWHTINFLKMKGDAHPEGRRRI